MKSDSVIIRFVYCFSFIICMCPSSNSETINLRDFGVIGDANSLDTVAFQKAIDVASEKRCTLNIPAGNYLVGSLHLRSHLHIQLEPGAVILGSQKREDYDPYEKLDFPNDADEETSFFHHALMWGEDIENVSITGFGKIDLNFTKRGGPKALAFKRCKNIRIEGITIQNIPNYTISLLGCEQVVIDKVQILNGYADGIDPDSCQWVFISNCHIETVDDAIVPKTSFSLGYHRPCTDITVTNCYLSTRCNGFKLGTETGSDFKRITFSNSVVQGLSSAQRPAISGVSIESVDGSNIEDVTITGIAMDWVRSPLFIRLGNRGRDGATSPGSIKGVTISNIVATRASNPNIIAGIPDYPVENVLIQNVFCSFDGGSPLRPVTEPVPEEIARYPEALMFGPLPSYAFYIRHARGIQLQNISFEAKPYFWRITMDKYKSENKNKKIVWNEQGQPTNFSEKSTPGIAVWVEDVQDFLLSDWCERGIGDHTELLWLKDVHHAQIDAPLHKRDVPHWCVIQGGEKDTLSIRDSEKATHNKNVKIQE